MVGVLIFMAGTVFQMIGTLQHLSMPQNGIHHVGISALADALTHNPDLQHLDLNDNTFTEKGSEAMAHSLPMLQKLEVINFGDCLVKSNGATVIAEALRDGHMELKVGAFFFATCAEISNVLVLFLCVVWLSECLTVSV